jgi:hypothetical protein
MSIHPSYYFEPDTEDAEATAGSGGRRGAVKEPLMSLRTFDAGKGPSSPDHKTRINRITSHICLPIFIIKSDMVIS